MIIKSSSENIKTIIKKIEFNIKVICCSVEDKFTELSTVYYNFGNKKQVTCQYCGTIYSKSKQKKKKIFVKLANIIISS